MAQHDRYTDNEIVVTRTLGGLEQQWADQKAANRARAEATLTEQEDRLTGIAERRASTEAKLMGLREQHGNAPVSDKIVNAPTPVAAPLPQSDPTRGIVPFISRSEREQAYSDQRYKSHRFDDYRQLVWDRDALTDLSALK